MVWCVRETLLEFACDFLCGVCQWLGRTMGKRSVLGALWTSFKGVCQDFCTMLNLFVNLVVASAGKLVVYTHFALSSVASFDSCVLSTLLF